MKCKTGEQNNSQNLVLKIIKAALEFTRGNDTYTYTYIYIYIYINKKSSKQNT